MWAIFTLQWLRLKREPLLVLSFLGMTLLFVFFLAGNQSDQHITVHTFSEDLPEEVVEERIDELNQSEDFQFESTNRADIEERIESSQISLGVQLEDDDYQLWVGQESQVLMAVDQYLNRYYYQLLRLNALDDDSIDVVSYIDYEIDSVIEQDGMAEKGYNAHVIIGMTLYFSMYTILFSVSNVVTEKRTGTWDRLVVSSLSKLKIYQGQLAYFFTLGMLQIGLSFFIFDYILGYELGSAYGSIVFMLVAYVFSIVALGMLIMGVVQSPQQLQAVIPIVATSMAMLGGALWSIELVSQPFLLLLARFVPIYYGIEGLRQAIIFEAGLSQMIEPASILFLMGVIFMGIGLNLMERK
ncbi:ABC-2 type transport system permease protein [Pelagirhabdus alkalitolerans]|uniref:ABC-2 type transport system permease protein n=1 Tax=Pelagirhabdus alkalitolerans TaxID=1612202 RepID=A0A1G6JP43_9BACI|nr:ABC transporter permease [Pelagirhabdus alkalitolerans]SDC20509.1 ABC-2 type transport system permease protein [Pelagirhabdus alkalitolerans]